MLCSELIDSLERSYPKSAAMTWDNVGLLVGRYDKEIHKVLVTLDVTDEVIARAIDEGADMILSHHPLVFSALKQVTSTTLDGRRILSLASNDICCYAAHTNYDVLRMADLAKERLQLTQTVPLEECEIEGKGIGKVGFLPSEMTLKECAAYVKDTFALPSVKVFGNPDTLVRSAAICPGSGKGMAQLALEKGAHVLITGDIDHHSGLDAVAENLMIIDAGHYGLEYIFIDDMAEMLASLGVEVAKAEITFPFCNL